MQTARRYDSPSPWLDRLRAEPARAVDSLLRGVAHLPGLQRASQSDAMIALLGDLPADAPERRLADEALCGWLQGRRASAEALLSRPGGTRRFIDETAEAFRAAWRLELPRCCAWVRANLLDLLRWADGFGVDASYDLGEAVLIAGAHLQQGAEYRFLWRGLCAQAAAPRLRHRLDVALRGLSRMPGLKAGVGPSDEAVAGMATWAAALPPNESLKSEVVREWRALKAVFPHQPKYWRERWEAICENPRGPHPFTGWLHDADQALKAPARPAAVKRPPMLPKNIPGLIRDFGDAVARDGLTEGRWLPMTGLLDQVERYADLTGESYYLVASCTSIAGKILPHAPGHALALTRRALLWAPSDGHAWSVRARALEHLGRADLAEAVLWESRRRVPSDPAFSCQLAELLYRSGRAMEAERLLRQTVDRGGDDGSGDRTRTPHAVALYTLAHLLVATGNRPQAAELAARYRAVYGGDTWHATLARLIGAGAAGTDEAHRFLMDKGQTAASLSPVPWDRRAMAAALEAEEHDGVRLGRIARVAESDLLTSLTDEAPRARGLALLDEALAADGSDAYAFLVKALALPGMRPQLRGQAGRFDGSLPVRLALAEDCWDELATCFPDGRPLIALVRLARGAADDAVRAELDRWTTTPARWDDGWGAYLRQRLKAHFDDGSAPLDLPALEHDALTQAVDVGWLTAAA